MAHIYGDLMKQGPLLAGFRSDVGSPALHLSVLGCLAFYVLFVLDPSSTDRAHIDYCYPKPQAHAACSFQLWDSMRYLELGRIFRPWDDIETRLQALSEGRVIVLGLTNYAIYLESYLALKYFPLAPQLLILIVNYLLFVLSIRNYSRAIALATGEIIPGIEKVFLLNPALLVLMCSVTKEIWGVYFFSCFLRYSLERRYLIYSFVTVFSLFFRETYALVGVLFGVIQFCRIPVLWVVIISSLGLYVIDNLSIFEALKSLRYNRSEQLGASSASIMNVLVRVQSIPFGHILAFPVITALNLFGVLFSPAFYVKAMDQVFRSSIFGSSILYFMVCVRLLFVGWRKIFVARQSFRDLFLAFSLIHAAFPVMQPRYYVPAFPLLAIWCLMLVRDNVSTSRNNQFFNDSVARS